MKLARITFKNFRPTPATPVHDCAVAVGIPLDQEAFFESLRRGESAGFASQFCAVRSGSAETKWWMYEQWIELAIEALSCIGKLGVKVLHNATLADFHYLFGRFKVITLLAQWRTAEFLQDDILDTALLFNGLCDPESKLARYVASLKQERTTPSSTEREALAHYLNEAMSRGVPVGGQQKTLGMETARQTELHLRRKKIESLIDGAFAGGAGIEFAEGFRTVDEIVSGIPSEFAGVLDLAVCQASLLGEEVRRKCRHAVVHMTEDFTDAAFRVLLYRETIRYLSKHGGNYIDASFNIRGRF